MEPSGQGAFGQQEMADASDCCRIRSHVLVMSQEASLALLIIRWGSEYG